MYKKIMVPLDGSELAGCVLHHAEALTKAFDVGEVFLVRVVEPFSPPYYGGDAVDAELVAKNEELRRVAAEKYIQETANNFNGNGAAVHPEVLFGRVAESLADYAQKHEVDLLIIASHGRSGISRWVMGSVAEKLLRTVNSPILIIRAPGSQCAT